METITACFCCRKKIHKRNEFQGLEGMVKLKNPEDNTLIEPIKIENDNSTATLVLQTDTNSSTTSNGDAESKRASSVPQRSLPDIPITEPSGNNDNYSDLYATVPDKVEGKPSPTPSLKKQTSISQHSSISQADLNSPYATVKNPTHGYDKVRKTNEEHPYAQLNAPTTSRNTNLNNKENPYENTDETEDVILPSINTNQNISESSLTESENSPQEIIPAAAAMLGMISASQELPYMTPPIVPQPNFSGDSQDSSKGYTSISVREPLANIIAQTKQQQRLSSKQRNDSHYATVSDDSDEMYAAIEDHNNQGDIYNSGSETYAQIQPTNQLVIVQINNQQLHQTIPTSTSNQTICISTVMTNSSRRSGLDVFDHTPLTLQQTTGIHSSGSINQANDQTPIPPPVDSLFAMHSRQASSSSNISYIGNIGSPKPEKRQANSPLPPTPKNGNSFSNLSNQSGRNSAVVEESPPKDIDGMYAKVMKKGKYANSPSQNNSPILGRRHVAEKMPDLKRSNSFKQPEHLRPRSDSYDKTNGNSLNIIENRKSEGGYSVVRTLFPDTSIKIEKPSVVLIEPGYESLPDTSSLNTNDPGYETLLKNPLLSVENNKSSKPNSDYDPNYEVLQPFNNNKLYTNTSGDDGYAKVLEKPTAIVDDKRNNSCDILNNDLEDDDVLDGYSKVKERKEKDDDDVLAGYSKVKDRSNKDDDILAGYTKVKERQDKDDDDLLAGYSKVKERIEIEEDDILAGYSKVKERKNKIEDDDENMPGYSSIKEMSEENSDFKNHGYASISEAKHLNDSNSSNKNLNNNNISKINNFNNNINNNININNNNNNTNNNNNNNEYKTSDNLTKNLINDNINGDDKCSDIYSTIDQKKEIKYNKIRKDDEEHKYSTIGAKNISTNKNNSLENLILQKNQLQEEIPPPLPPVGNRSPELLPNKKLENSINYVKKENPYEKVKDIVTDSKLITDTKITKNTNIQENGSVLVVDDYFQV